jgi:hypothetical protein
VAAARVQHRHLVVHALELTVQAAPVQTDACKPPASHRKSQQQHCRRRRKLKQQQERTHAHTHAPIS